MCALCLVDVEGLILSEARGTFPGVITDEARGDNGFGYDRTLFLPDVGKTSAELSPDEKFAQSHRGAAPRALHHWLLQNPFR